MTRPFAEAAREYGQDRSRSGTTFLDRRRCPACGGALRIAPVAETPRPAQGPGRSDTDTILNGEPIVSLEFEVTGDRNVADVRPAQ